MIEAILMATGRFFVWLAYSFPLGRRFLDEEFRDDEARHFAWGVITYAGVLFALVMLMVGRLGLFAA